jgi:hypothetical protein
MPDFLQPIRKELAITRLEIVPPLHHKANFNETLIESQLQFNGFHSIRLYVDHLQLLYERGKANVNDHISKEVNTSLQFIKLEEVNFYVHECKKSIGWTDMSVENHHIDFVDNSSVRWEADFQLQVGKKSDAFWRPVKI